MTLQEETINLEAEVDRLESELRETAEKAAGLDDDNPRKSELLQEGRQLDARLAGVRWAVSEWDVDEVTLAGLTGGEFGKIEDGLQQDGTTGSGATRVFLVESGTVDAPYVSDDMTEDQRIASVGQLPITYLKWADARINEMTTLGGNGNETRFADLLEESRQKRTSTEN